MNIVIYHSNCPDGFAAAWVASQYLDPVCTTYVPASYGDDPPDILGHNVYVLDFSYDRQTTLGMFRRANKMVVLDHHASAEKHLAGLDFCVFDKSKSGAMLAHEYFAVLKKAPRLVQYVQDRDLWKWELSLSKQVNAYLSSVEKSFQKWTEANHMLETDIALASLIGEGVLGVISRYVEQNKSRARKVHVCGHLVPCINTTFAHSELLEELAHGHPFAAGWFQREDGSFVYSLRSRPPNGIDVSEVAMQMGGGGHAAAAGFTLKERIIDEPAEEPQELPGGSVSRFSAARFKDSERFIDEVRSLSLAVSGGFTPIIIDLASQPDRRTVRFVAIMADKSRIFERALDGDHRRYAREVVTWAAEEFFGKENMIRKLFAAIDKKESV